MKRNEIKAILEPMLSARLHKLVKRDLGNGTPLADAVASVIALDMAAKGSRMAKTGAEQIAGLTDAVLRGVIRDFEQCMKYRRTNVEAVLPFGTVMAASWQAGVKVGIHHYHPLRGIPGLHSGDALGLPSRPGAALLRTAVVKALSTLPPSDIPTPEEDSVKIEHRWKTRDTIHIPVRGGPGVTYLRPEHISSAEIMLDSDIAEHAAFCRNIAENILENSDSVDLQYERILAKIQPILNKAKREGVHFKFNGVQVDDSYGTTRVIPKFEVLGNDLRPVTWEAQSHNPSGVEKTIESQFNVQRRRKKILQEAGSLGARGRVDEVTLRAIEAFSTDPAKLLRSISKRRSITLQAGRNGKKTDPVRLAWRNGRVESSFAITDKVNWNYGRIIFKNVELPEAVINTLVGKPISALVEHPFLNGEHVIRSVRNPHRGGWLIVNLDVAWTVFDEETGERLHIETGEQKFGENDEDISPAGDGCAQGDMLEMMQ